MKKLFVISLMILSLVFSSVSFGTAEEVAPLTVDEVDTYLEWLREEVMKDEALQVKESQEEGLYYASFSGGVLVLADSELNENTAIVRAELGVHTEDLRSVSVTAGEDEGPMGRSLEDVLSNYPLHNPELYGTYEGAVVSMIGSLPGNAFAGIAKRQGQKMEDVTYWAYETVGNTVAKAGVRYFFSENQLTGITVYGRSESEFAKEELDEYAALQEENAYFTYPSGTDGEKLEIMSREDLTFSGMDFLSLTVEKMIERFGSPIEDEWMEDTDGTYLRVTKWNGIEMTVRYDESKTVLGISSLYVSAPMLEGPRGVCLEDSLNSVIYRFRHGQGKTDEKGRLLYGDGEKAPYGTLSYEGNDAYMIYVTSTPDGDAALQMSFSQMRLTGFTLLMLNQN